MHVGTDCSWLDERTDLTDNVVGTIMINQQLCSCMIEHDASLWSGRTRAKIFSVSVQ